MRNLLVAVCLMSCAPMPAEDGVPGSAGAMGQAGRDGRDAVQGGSRLQPMWLVGADGTRMATQTFFDTQRNERCIVFEVAPGSLVCAPADLIGKLTAESASAYVRFSVQQ